MGDEIIDEYKLQLNASGEPYKYIRKLMIKKCVSHSGNSINLKINLQSLTYLNTSFHFIAHSQCKHNSLRRAMLVIFKCSTFIYIIPLKRRIEYT